MQRSIRTHSLPRDKLLGAKAGAPRCISTPWAMSGASGNQESRRLGGLRAPLLGMQLTDKSRGTLALRMDRPASSASSSTPTAVPKARQFYGWEAADASSAGRCSRRIWRRTTSGLRAPACWADERRAKDLIASLPTRSATCSGAFRRRRDRDRPVQARLLDFRLLHRPARRRPTLGLPRSRPEEVLPFSSTRDPQLQADSTYILKPFKAVLLPYQSTPPLCLAFIDTFGKNGIHHLDVRGLLPRRRRQGI